MSHTGKKDKGQKEQKKKSKHTLKEKRKLKQEKHQQADKKHIVIPKAPDQKGQGSFIEVRYTRTNSSKKEQS